MDSKDVKNKREESETNANVAVQHGFHYDAFISYRHCDLDKFVAENLHKLLEAYRMPADVLQNRKGMKNRIERVFRDKEELPLTSNLNDPIMMALNNSDWLIVICSPRLRESVWCKKEIETFINLHGREKVLAVLIEGEPAESFPEELLFKTEVVTKADGSTEEVKIPVEPLAADVRGKNKKEILKNLKAELLRILAAMFHMNFDDLRQRHKEQEHKRKMHYMALVASLCFLVTVISVGIALQMNYKNQMIQRLSDNIYEQNQAMKLEQAENLAETALDYLEEGDRESAVASAYMALTEYESMTMPYTAAAQFALAKSVRAYDMGEVLMPQYQIETMGIVRDIQASQDGNTLAVYDDTGTLVLYDLISGSKIFELPSGAEGTSYKDGYVFLGGNRFAYWNASLAVKIYDINEREVIATFNEESASRIFTDPSGKYLVIEGLLGGFTIYDALTLECVGKIPETENGGIPEGVSVNSDGVLSFAYSILAENSYEVYFADCNSLELIQTVVLKDVNQINDIRVNGSTAYILATYHDAVSPTDSYCYVCAVDIQSGVMLWEDIQTSCTAQMICLPEKITGNALLTVTDDDIRLLDMYTGEIILKMAMKSPVVQVGTDSDGNAFEVLCEDGTWLLADPGVAYPMDISGRFDCKTEHNALYCITPYEMFVVAQQDNRITAYTCRKADAVVPVEDKIELPEMLVLYEKQAQDKALEYGVKDANYVYSFFTDPAQEILFVSYYNGDVMVFDTYQDLEYTIEDCNVLTGYFGRDDDKNTYVSCIGGGYILSPEYRKVMYVPNMAAVDLEQDKVYMSGIYGTYEAPIYTTEELLRMAEPYMIGTSKERMEEDDTSGN